MNKAHFQRSLNGEESDELLHTAEYQTQSPSESCFLEKADITEHARCAKIQRWCLDFKPHYELSDLCKQNAISAQSNDATFSFLKRSVKHTSIHNLLYV